MIEFVKKYWFLSLLAFLAFFLLGVKLLFFKEPLPGIAKIDPLPETKIETNIAKITITFDQKVAKILPDLVVASDPEVELTLADQDQQLIVNLKSPLTPETAYSWQIKYKTETLWQWHYDVKAEPTVREIGNPEAVKEITEKAVSDYPLIRYMPYSTDRFAMNYSAPKKLVVVIKSGDFEKVRQEVLDWISAKGIDPKTHEIEWRE